MRLFPHPKRVKNKLLEEFKGKSILALGGCGNLGLALDCQFNNRSTHDLKSFPWPVSDNTYDLIICQNILQHLPDTAKTLEELNRIVAPGGKIFIETPHFTWEEGNRLKCHRFSLASFDDYLKGNPFYKTDFVPSNKYLFFDDLMFVLGIGFLANLFPIAYEKRLAFIFPASSFHVTFHVDK